MAETELERAEKRYAQAKARLQGLKNREATRQRKMDTRRKVILGGALLDLAERDSGAAAMLERLIRNLSRQQDRKAFADWEGQVSGDDGSESVSGPVSEQEQQSDG
ncbi:mobilization protein [Phaeobacter italicus]|jgi:mevalonate pyrophosphate decarboxylase|uniref:mobilization protein n=1 Tax=Phaeobacter italicus TaxID=481446 RepID=UPI003515ACAE